MSNHETAGPSQTQSPEQQAPLNAQEVPLPILPADSNPISNVQMITSTGIQARVKQGIMDIANTKKYLEESLTHKVHEAQARLSTQAETQHETFTTMSQNNMVQYTDKVTTLLKDKCKELSDSTDTWKEHFESACESATLTHSSQFEKSCEDIHKQINQEHQEKTEVYLNKREIQINAEAKEAARQLNTIQDALVLEEAQCILNQMPLDMGILKDELQDELRTYGDGACGDLEYAHEEHHLQTIGQSLMTELQHQAAAHKTKLNNIITYAQRQSTSTTGGIRAEMHIITELHNTL